MKLRASDLLTEAALAMRYCLEPGVHSTCWKVILISTQSVYFVLVVPTGNPGIQVV